MELQLVLKIFAIWPDLPELFLKNEASNRMTDGFAAGFCFLHTRLKLVVLEATAYWPVI